MSQHAYLKQYQEHGLTFLDIDHTLGFVKLCTFGAQVLSYVPASDGVERLFVSPHACMNGEKAIRGGIPICWPWFSDAHGQAQGSLPAHGFMRTRVWHLTYEECTEDKVELHLQPSSTQGPGFNAAASLTLKIVLSDSLELSLVTHNVGHDAFQFDTALHTYFYVDDIRQVTLEGLTGDYLDKTMQWAKAETPSPYCVVGEVDRIHLTPAPSVEINIASKRRTTVMSRGHDSIVVWNPWLGAASISDMDAFGFKHMICVETAVTQHKILAPGESHLLVQQIRG
jgi:glucose-6-phosphate 1-epimerase